MKRDLAVEARAAQKLARSRDGRHGHRSSEQSVRGRTRAATQADLRPIRMQQDEQDVSDDEYTPGSRRSALRRRVDSGPSTSDLDESSSNEDTWQTENTTEMRQFSNPEGREWGNDWRQQVPSTPERSHQEVQQVATPMTPQSSEYDYSPRGSIGRTSSVGSSLTSSSTTGSSPTSAGVFHSSPYPFDSATSDCSQSPTTPIDTPAAGKAAKTMRAAQITPPDHGLSLAAMVDASMGDWSSPSHSMSLRQFEPFGWGSAFGEGVSSSPDPMAVISEAVTSEAQQIQLASQAPHYDDFGFIDLFSTSVEDGSGGEPSSSMTSSLDSGTEATEVKMDGFMKEAEAAGVFGLEDFLLPRGSYAGPVDYA